MTAPAFAAQRRTAPTFFRTTLHCTAPTLFRTAPALKTAPHLFYYTDDNFISELLFISIWQSFSQYFVKNLIKIMLKIDFEIDLKLSQANIAKILVDLRLEKSTCAP